MTNQPQQIKPSTGILGFGRFGKIMAQMLETTHSVFFYDTSTALQNHPNFLPLDKLIQLPTLILAVPIRDIESTLKAIAPNLKSDTVIDVCSVKVHPVNMMLQYLPQSTHLIATHPMFGPDSYTTNPHKNMMMHATRVPEALFQQWYALFAHHDIDITLMTPEEHDKEAAYSQNVTHFIGRVLNELDLNNTPISTAGFKSLLHIMTQTCHDRWDLFHDMVQYNPYSKTMIESLNEAMQTVSKKLDQ